jgi:hypothetical protein
VRLCTPIVKAISRKTTGALWSTARWAHSFPVLLLYESDASHSHCRRAMSGSLVPRLSAADRGKLEVAGMTPRDIDDAIAHLLLQGMQSFTVQDLLDVGPLGEEESLDDSLSRE